ncbi:MAG: DUF2779 domain-containing protein, partial [Deltaproteobacteria bacterium]|nr:DUF2779 domain-containing protein [Deltaproteobacteria bacterium]
VLYEAALVNQGVMASIDILVKDGDRWKAYEVKSGGSLHDTYVEDACLQHWVLSGAGLELADISVVYIDKSYVRHGDLDVQGLFTMSSVLHRALAQADEIGRTVTKLHEIIAAVDVPEISIGPHCFDPYTCSFKGHCWGEMPERTVFDLSKLGQKQWQLYEQGIVRLADIPQSFALNEKQHIEVRAAATGEPHIETAAVREFVGGLEYPVYHLDFETVGPAIPLFDGTSPYEQVPFQYSLHRRDEPGGELQHCAFLGDGKTDPRAALVEQLIADAGMKGHVLSYTPYERTQLNNLIGAVPSRAAELQAIVDRLVDLSDPFRNHDYYTAEMDGRYSIKNVLPALVPDLSYEGLDISEGMAASNAYENLHYETDLVRIAEVRQALLDYCGLDTLAMVKILEVLERV